MKKFLNGAFSLVESAVLDGASGKQIVGKAIFILFAGGATYGFDSYRTNQRLAELSERVAKVETSSDTLRIAVAAHEKRLTYQDQKIDKKVQQQDQRIDHIDDNTRLLLNKMVRLEASRPQ